MGGLDIVKKAMRYLNTGYLNGIFGYPRVDNSFIMENKGFDLFPHPTLIPMSASLEPLPEGTKIKVDKEYIILFLSSIGIISPSQIESVFEYIDYYLNDELAPKTESLEVEALKIIEILDSFLLQRALNDAQIVHYEQQFAEASRESWSHSMMFKIATARFISKGSEKKALKGYMLKKYNQEEGVMELGSKQSLRTQLDLFRDEELQIELAQQYAQEQIQNQSMKGIK
ncbi:MAG: hypothetical protein IE916_00205 [Epsilonproteobacteria bacterium]|nr:hypothetical protein [Campylobacterota bacterium]